MSDAKVTRFRAEAVDCVGMIHRKVNHRDTGEICDQNISHHSSTYIRVAPWVRHLNTIKGLDSFCRHFRVTDASRAMPPPPTPQTNDHPRADRSRSICQDAAAFRLHISHERNHP